MSRATLLLLGAIWMAAGCAQSDSSAVPFEMRLLDHTGEAIARTSEGTQLVVAPAALSIELDLERGAHVYVVHYGPDGMRREAFAPSRVEAGLQQLGPYTSTNFPPPEEGDLRARWYSVVLFAAADRSTLADLPGQMPELIPAHDPEVRERELRAVAGALADARAGTFELSQFLYDRPAGG